LFLLAIVCYHLPNCQAFYLRAHKREPLFLLGVVASLLIGAGVWWFGSRHGPTGAAWAYLAIVVCVVFPWQTLIWWQCRREHELVREENALIRANGTDPPDLPSAGPGSRVEG